MSANHSSGSIANAICRRCGLRFAYTALRTETDTALRVCDDCLDNSDPYRSLVISPDNLSLENPSPDVDISV